MNNTNYLKLLLVLIFSFLLIQSCGKKDSTTSEQQKTDNRTETKSDVKDLVSLDKPVYIEFEMTGGNVTGTFKTYYKGKKMKSDYNMKSEGKDIKSAMYSDGSTIYTISEVEGKKMGIKMDASKFYDPSNKQNKGFDISSFKDRMKDFTKVGGEDVIGRHCEIYQSNKDSKLRMWVYNELIPLKIQNDKMTLTATKLDVDVNVNDDVFNPPSDVNYMDMNDMMKGLQNYKK